METEENSDAQNTNGQRLKLAKPYYSLGKALGKKGEWEEAIASYQKALELAPHSEEVRQSLADAENKLQEKNVNGQTVKEAGGKMPHYKLGKILAGRGEWEEAIACYRKSIEVEPNFADIYHCLGDALVETGEKEEAIRVCQKAIEIEPNLWEVHHKLGNLLQEVGQLDEAVGAYQKSIELKSDFCWSLNNLGDVLVKLEKWEEAAGAYGQAVELNHDFPWGHYKLGDVLVELEDWEGAIGAYERSIKLPSLSLPNIYEKLGDALQSQISVLSEKAINSYRQAIQQNPDDIELYHKALEVKPNEAELYFDLANALVRQNERDEAIVFYQIALQIAPKYLEARLNLEDLLAKRERGFEDNSVESQSNSVDFYVGDRCYSKINSNLYLQKPPTTWDDLSGARRLFGEDDINNHPTQEPNKLEKLFSVKAPLTTINKSYEVNIIVCVHNALEDVKACLNSIIRNAVGNYRLLVVDDGSEKDTEEFLQSWVKQVPKASLFRNDTALGYTKAANIGLRASTGDYSVLLNSDTIVTPSWIEKLIECGESDGKIGIIGPLSNCATWQSVPEVFAENGGWKNNDLPSGYSLEQFADLIEKLSEKAFPRVNFINGFCYTIKRSVLNAIGFLDEGSFPFGYGEENDFSLRAKQAGFQLAIADHAYVYHSKSKSFGHDRRKKLSKDGSAALKKKYPDLDIKALANEVKDNQHLEQLRQKLRSYF